MCATSNILIFMLLHFNNKYQYILYRNVLVSRKKTKMEKTLPAGTQINEQKLFHGTCGQYMDAICQQVCVPDWKMDILHSVLLLQLISNRTTHPFEKGTIKVHVPSLQTLNTVKALNFGWDLFRE